MTTPYEDDPRLTAYALGELPESERQEMEEFLYEHPEALETVSQICEYFGISPRTAQRYRKALNESLVAGDGGDFLRVFRDGGIEKWYLADQEEIMTATFFRIMSVYVATVF